MNESFGGTCAPCALRDTKPAVATTIDRDNNEVPRTMNLLVWLTFALTRGRVPLLDVAAVASRHEPPPNGSCWPKADLEPKGFEHGLHFGKPLPTRLRISRKTNRAFL